MKTALLSLVVLGAGLTAFTPTALAHCGFHTEGFATNGTSAVRIFIDRALDPPVNPIINHFSVRLADIVTGATIEHRIFGASDNFCPEGEEEPPTLNTAYHGESTDPNVDFEIDGVSAFELMTSHGHYGDYQFAGTVFIPV